MHATQNKDNQRNNDNRKARLHGTLISSEPTVSDMGYIPSAMVLREFLV